MKLTETELFRIEIEQELSVMRMEYIKLEYQIKILENKPTRTLVDALRLDEITEMINILDKDIKSILELLK